MADEMIGQTKVCTKCNTLYPATLAVFPPHKLGRFGLHPFCRVCKREDDAARRSRPDQKARQQAWRAANRGYVKAYNDEYRKAHPSTPWVARWRAKNLERARTNEAAAKRRRRATDDAFILKERIASRLGRLLRGKANRSTERLLGYTKDELRRHIERQFTRGMSWERLRRREIEIDHIVPVSAFAIDSADHPDFMACWGLHNLRPLWAKENRSKGKKRLTLL